MSNPLRFLSVLKESREFEEYLRSYDELWKRQSRQQQLRQVPGVDQSSEPVVKTLVSQDDLGGPQGIQRLKQSKMPEADLRKMVSQAEKERDFDRAARITDFIDEFSLQRREIGAGLRQNYQNLNTVNNAMSGGLPKPTQPTTQADYLQPAPLPSQIAGEPQGRETIRKNKDGSISYQQSAPTGQFRRPFADLANQARDGNRLSRTNPEAHAATQRLKAQVDKQLEGLKGEERQKKKDALEAQVQKHLASLKGSEEAPSGQQASASNLRPTGTLTPLMNPDQGKTFKKFRDGGEESQSEPEAQTQTATAEPTDEPKSAKGNQKGSKSKGFGVEKPSQGLTARTSKRISGGSSRSSSRSMKTGGKDRRVADDQRSKVNPFNKRATKDPNLQTQLDAASKRVTAIRKQQKDLIDQIKTEKNPVIKERLSQMLEGLDRQLGVAYIALDRIKQLSGLTTSSEIGQFEQMRSLFRDIEKLSTETAIETRKYPEVFKAQDILSKRKGGGTLADFFTDDNAKMRERFSKLEKQDSKLDAYADKVNNASQDELNKLMDDLGSEDFEGEFELMAKDADKDDAEIESSIEAFFSGDTITKERQSMLDGLDPEDVYNPYEGETANQYEKRQKKERVISRQRKESDELINPHMAKASDLATRGKTKEIQDDGRRMFNFLFGLKFAIESDIRDKEKRQGLNQRSKEILRYSKSSLNDLDNDLDRIPTQLGTPSSQLLVDRIERLRGKNGATESEIMLAKEIARKHSFTKDGKLTPYGKRLQKALVNYESNAVGERKESIDTINNLMYSASSLDDQYHVEQDNEGNGLDVSLMLDKTKISPMGLKAKQTDAFLKRLDTSSFDITPTGDWQSDPAPFKTSKDDPASIPNTIEIKPKDGVEIKQDDAYKFFQSMADKGNSDYSAEGPKKRNPVVVSISRHANDTERAVKLAGALYKNNPKYAQSLVRSISKALDKFDESDLKPEVKTSDTKDNGLDLSTVVDLVKSDQKKTSQEQEIDNERALQIFQDMADGVTRNEYFEVILGMGNLLMEAIGIQRYSMAAKTLREARKMKSKLMKTKTYMSEQSGNQSGYSAHLMKKLNEDISFLNSKNGIKTMLDLEEEINLLPAEQQMKYRLADQDFRKVNEYYYPSEKIALCLESSESPNELTQPQLNPYTYNIQKEEKSFDANEFYASLMEVSKQVSDNQFAKASQKASKQARVSSVTKDKRHGHFKSIQKDISESYIPELGRRRLSLSDFKNRR
jgi:hypothetical protein